MKPLILIPIAAFLAPAVMLNQPPAPCALTVSPDEVRGVAYHVRLQVAPSCPASTVFRVRKSSTINVKRKGAPYQPIKPLEGAWEISKARNTVPAAELWTSLTWRWERFDPDQMNTLTGEAGRWRGIPVARTP